MESIVRVEMPLVAQSKILSVCKTIGDLMGRFPNLKFVKYIYIDPSDGKLKGVNPPKDTPLVENAYITVTGTYDDIIKFAEEATKK